MSSRAADLCRVRGFARGILLAVCLLTGCSYQCHTYRFVAAEAENGEWRVSGELERMKPESSAHERGSFPHWSPDPQDRYTLVLVPVAPDPKYWQHGQVDIENVRVLAGGGSVSVEWSTPDRRRFESSTFHIPEAPDVLPIEFDLLLLDAESGKVTGEIHMECHAVADRHRRWYIADMANS